MTEYKPGTVAVATVRGVPNVRVMRCMWKWCSGEPVEGRKFHVDGTDVTDVRPLIVLDPEGVDTAPQDTIPYLVRALRASDSDGYGPTLRMLAAQIEAQTRPPKPEEPTGLGAVVADAEGRRWIRVDWPNPWCLAQPQKRNDGKVSHGSHLTWGGIDAVRVLSQGVQP